MAENLPARFEGSQVFLEDEDVSGQIRSEAIGMGASAVAQLPKVRTALLQRQRDFLTEKVWSPTGAIWVRLFSLMRR